MLFGTSFGTSLSSHPSAITTRSSCSQARSGSASLKLPIFSSSTSCLKAGKAPLESLEETWFLIVLMWFLMYQPSVSQKKCQNDRTSVLSAEASFKVLEKAPESSKMPKLISLSLSAGGSPDRSKWTQWTQWTWLFAVLFCKKNS